MRFQGIKCPVCASTSVRRREQVYKSGTSLYRGRNSNVGVSFGLSKKSRPRVWYGVGNSSGTRQSVLATEAERLPYWPAIVMLIILSFIIAGQKNIGFWGWAALAFVGLWIAVAISDHRDFKLQWWCSKCGERFIPTANETQKKLPLETSKVEMVEFNEMSTDHRGKACSICGSLFPDSEFSYRNRKNRSYCQACDKEEMAAYGKGGKEAARQYREEKRAEWQPC